MNCTVPGCGRKARVRGWCQGHYQRWNRTGQLRPDVPLDRPPKRERPKPKAKQKALSDLSIGEGLAVAAGPRMRLTGWCECGWHSEVPLVAPEVMDGWEQAAFAVESALHAGTGCRLPVTVVLEREVPVRPDRPPGQMVARGVTVGGAA